MHRRLENMERPREDLPMGRMTAEDSISVIIHRENLDVLKLVKMPHKINKHIILQCIQSHSGITAVCGRTCREGYQTISNHIRTHFIQVKIFLKMCKEEI